MKGLNLYCGLGGNRKLWQGVDVTAVELNPEIARFYKDHFPEDEVIVTDAHKYLLDNFARFDFIWSSFPCPTHSRARFWASKGGKSKPVYPDLGLYEEILLLKHYYEGRWVVENVNPFYDPLLPPTRKIGRHLFWSNFYIPQIQTREADIKNGKRDEWSSLHGFDITGYNFNERTDKILRNCVYPPLGLKIFESAMGGETVKELSLF